MRVGIVGAGSMGATHAAAWAETPAEIIGFVAATPSDAQALAAQYHARTFPDLDALIAQVDVVDICAPTHLHAEMAQRAALAAKHVVCEKPLARTVEQGRAMLAACRAAGVKLLVAHVVRYFPEYALARAQVEQGNIGKPAVLRLSRGSIRPRKAVDNWFLDPEKSGGVLMDMMVHDYDYARWVAGGVESVFARSIGSVHPDAPVDYGMAILQHTGGALSHIAGAWAYPPPTFRTHLEIAGDRGLIEYDSEATAPISLLLQNKSADTTGEVGLPSSPLSESPYVTQIKEFYRALADDQPVRVAAEDGLAAVQIAVAAVASARTGKAVAIADFAEAGR